MKQSSQCLFLFVLMMTQLNLMAQDVEIEGKLKVNSVAQDLQATEVIVRQTDGTLAKRSIASLRSAHYIGELMGAGGVDGVVFWVDHTGEHGLICSSEDIAASVGNYEMHWNSGSGQILTSATSLWDGRANTSKILSEDPNSIAAKKCNEYTTSGTSTGDWYLPARLELSKMYHAQYEISNALSEDTILGLSYWSSSEFNNLFAWRFDFRDGAQSSDRKASLHSVRAVRAF